VVAINLAAAIKAMGFKVLLIDADFSNPSVGVYLGMEDVNIGYREVVLGRTEPQRAIIPHYATGLNVLPGTITTKQFMPTKSQLETLGHKLSKMNYDFIIVDTQPGLGFPEFFKRYNEAIIVTTPEMSACLSAVKLAHIYNTEKIKHSLVVNRVKNKRYEISIGEIEDIYENRVLGVLPEDEAVPISLAQHVPAYTLNRNSAFSKNIRNLARIYVGRADVGELEKSDRMVRGGGVIGFLKRLFRLQ
jgi:flagellar biosynthesis protein FlhG